jgi:hypothetical protein
MDRGRKVVVRLIIYPCAVCVFPEGGDSESYHKNKAKRVRTTFTEEQLQVLQANFQLDSNPDGQDLERIAQITGLSKRVTQVWFQNSRARQKKHLHTGKMKTPSEYVARSRVPHPIRRMSFCFNLPNASCRTGPWGSLSL